MTARAASPFRDSSGFADLTWVATNDLPLPADELAAFFDSGAAQKFLELPAGCQYVVQATGPPGRLSSQTDGSQTDETSDVRMAMAIFTLHSTTTDPKIRNGSVVCILRGLAVNPGCRGGGLGHALFGRVHSYAFEQAQLVTTAERANGYDLPPAPVFDFRLHPGCCFREPRALLIYQRNGASITVDSREVGEEQLRSWAKKELQPRDNAIPLPRQQVSYSAMRVEVHFPAVDLTAPYLAPTAFPSKADGLDAFESMQSAGAVPTDVFHRRSDSMNGSPLSLIEYNTQLRLGSLSIAGAHADPLTGCFDFYIPALPCSLLEHYLRDPKNTVPTTTSSHVGLVLQRDEAGLPTRTVTGYSGYSITAAEFDGGSQAARTRLFTRKEDKEALLQLPGCLALLALAAAKLKWSLDFMKRPYQVHILLQDDDLQAGFGWHTDGDGTKIGKRREGNLVSLAIQLSCSAVSAMWVHGFQPCIYGGRGACVLFHGGCLHRSLPWAPQVFEKNPNCNVIKIVFFYADVTC